MHNIRLRYIVNIKKKTIFYRYRLIKWKLKYFNKTGRILVVSFDFGNPEQKTKTINFYS